jgi:hypothetical protein
LRCYAPLSIRASAECWYSEIAVPANPPPFGLWLRYYRPSVPCVNVSITATPTILVACVNAAASARQREAGRLRPVIDRTMPLSEGVRAQALLEERRVFGKIVLTM